MKKVLSPRGGFYPAIEQGAHVFHSNHQYFPELGGLKLILRGRNSSIRKLEESMQKAIDEKVEELRRELEESRRKESHQEREEEKRRAREEADGFRKCIAELQSKLEEDRHGSGKALRHT